MSIRQRQQIIQTMTNELLTMLNNLDDMPNLRTATPEQLNNISNMSRKRFCMMYFKSVCIVAIVLILGALSYNVDNAFNLLDNKFHSANFTQH